MEAKTKIKAALKATTISRAGKLDQLTLTVYSNRLVREDERDVLAALEKLAERKREDYETALPEIGVMVSLVEVERIARQNRSQIKRSERLVAWTCPDCFNRMTGFPQGGDSLDRRCSAPYKQVDGKRVSLPPGQICGARMQVHLDDANTHEDGPVTKWEMSRR